jgi:hypothetical protein
MESKILPEKAIDQSVSKTVQNQSEVWKVNLTVVNNH